MLRSVFIAILLPLLSGIILSCGSSGDVCVNDDLTEDVLLRLDSVIVSRDSYLGEKECRLDSLKSLVPSVDDEGRYRLYDWLFGEYYSYDLDSAVMYATRKAEVAQRFSGGPRLSVARLNLAPGASRPWTCSRGGDADAAGVARHNIPCRQGHMV